MPNLVSRFWAKVVKTNECWEWCAAFHGSGYGIFGIGGTKIQRAHRFSWELSYGKIPEGLFVLHKCDNRKCVRPEHLFLGTNLDNVRDMIAKRRNSPPPFMGGRNRRPTPKEMTLLLGLRADTEIARKFGVTKYFVQRRRRELGISAVPCLTRFKKGDPHPRWSRKKGG